MTSCVGQAQKDLGLKGLILSANMGLSGRGLTLGRFFRPAPFAARTSILPVTVVPSGARARALFYPPPSVGFPAGRGPLQSSEVIFPIFFFLILFHKVFQMQKSSRVWLIGA